GPHPPQPGAVRRAGGRAPRGCRPPPRPAAPRPIRRRPRHRRRAAPPPPLGLGLGAAAAGGAALLADHGGGPRPEPPLDPGRRLPQGAGRADPRGRPAGRGRALAGRPGATAPLLSPAAVALG